MSSSGVSPLKEILVLSRKDWDRDDMRADVRQAFQKVLDCRTEALGAEVFGSREEERTVFHTCKSRACPSCGRRAMLLWQREQWRELPDVPYAHVTLTMPDVLWPIFRRNRHLLHDLPVLGAQVIQEWARARYGVRLMIVVIPHTFGRHLNFNCHLHVLVSEGGLREDGTEWQHHARLNPRAIMPMWRYAVIHYLRAALKAGILTSEASAVEMKQLLRSQYERWWNIDIKRFRTKKHFLGYAGRYARRPPIAQHRFRKIDADEVTFSTRDTKTKQVVETRYTMTEFVSTLVHHIPDRYRHNVRHFGLLAPRLKARSHDLIFRLLDQERLGKPKHLPWARSLRKHFGIDPLIDTNGQRMRWLRRVPPATTIRRTV